MGAANGKNPISIIAPCHRVIGVGGALVGFAGGLDKKDIFIKIRAKNKLFLALDFSSFSNKLSILIFHIKRVL